MRLGIAVAPRVTVVAAVSVAAVRRFCFEPMTSAPAAGGVPTTSWVVHSVPWRMWSTWPRRLSALTTHGRDITEASRAAAGMSVTGAGGSHRYPGSSEVAAAFV